MEGSVRGSEGAWRASMQWTGDRLRRRIICLSRPRFELPRSRIEAKERICIEPVNAYGELPLRTLYRYDRAFLFQTEDFDAGPSTGGGTWSIVRVPCRFSSTSRPSTRPGGRLSVKFGLTPRSWAR